MALQVPEGAAAFAIELPSFSAVFISTVLALVPVVVTGAFELFASTVFSSLVVSVALAPLHYKATPVDRRPGAVAACVPTTLPRCCVPGADQRDDETA